MTVRARSPDGSMADSRNNESWLHQRARRKQAVARGEDPDRPAAPAAPRHPAPPADSAPPPLPPLDSLDADSDYSGFLHPQVSEALQRVALRKLFHSVKFNVVDGLDDYAEDYRNFEALGDVVTADMRLRMERAAERRQEPSAAGTKASPAEPSAATPPPAQHETPAVASGVAATDQHEQPDEHDDQPRPERS
jgi:hypothetical protein